MRNNIMGTLYESNADEQDSLIVSIPLYEVRHSAHHLIRLCCNAMQFIVLMTLLGCLIGVGSPRDRTTLACPIQAGVAHLVVPSDEYMAGPQEVSLAATVGLLQHPVPGRGFIPAREEDGRPIRTTTSLRARG